MKIELTKCKSCWKILDQYLYPPICSCGSRWSTAVNPTKYNLIKWFLGNPKHVINLIKDDLWGNHETRM